MRRIRLQRIRTSPYSDHVCLEDTFEGWEEEKPATGKPYFLLLDSDRILETTCVVKVQRNYLITNQTVYRFTEVESEARPPSQQKREGMISTLTPRERAIFLLLIKGLSVNEAADSLGISPKTAGFYKRHLMQKLQLNSISQLIRRAIKTGVLQLEP